MVYLEGVIGYAGYKWGRMTETFNNNNVVPTSGAIDRLMNMINICCELVDKILCLKVKGKKSYADIVKISSVCA